MAEPDSMTEGSSASSTNASNNSTEMTLAMTMMSIITAPPDRTEAKHHIGLDRDRDRDSDRDTIGPLPTTTRGFNKAPANMKVAPPTTPQMRAAAAERGLMEDLVVSPLSASGTPKSAGGRYFGGVHHHHAGHGHTGTGGGAGDMSAVSTPDTPDLGERLGRGV
jgi:hypothetical protein